MLKRVVLITISLVLAFSLLAFSPQSASAASTSKLTITNPTGDVVTITFTGPKYYRVQAQPGKTTVDVEKGYYTLKMNPCKAYNIEGKVSALKAKSAFKIAKCSLLKVNNRTGGYLTINLSGPSNYRFVAGVGVTTFKVYKGSYTAKIYGCGSSMTTTMNLNKNQSWTFWCR